MTYLFVLTWIFVACAPPQQVLEPQRREDSEPPSRVEVKELHPDEDGNDDWERAGEVKLLVERAYLLDGELGAVDSDGVLDVVDYYRFQARHASMLVFVEGDVDVSVVTANDASVQSASELVLWYDALSIDGGYALRVATRSESSTGYVLRIAAGGHVREPCADGCRFGLSCADGRCVQAAATGAHCLHDGDCRLGLCQQQRCVDVGESCKSVTAGDSEALCRSCDSDADCLFGDCRYNVCWVGQSCEAGGGVQCRAGVQQICIAEQWVDVGRCDTGCLAGGCAPLPPDCQVEQAQLCMGQRAAVCDGQHWSGYGSDPSCGRDVSLEGESCSSSEDCTSPLTCMQTDPLTSGQGVCAMPCQVRGADCHDGKKCGLLLDNSLFCMDTSSSSSCSLASLRGCRGAIAGACIEYECWPTCELASCPGTGCACGSSIDCQPIDNRGALASVGLCANVVGVGGVCDEHNWCDDGSLCVVESSYDTSGICRAECSGSCPAGFACYELTSGTSACLPD